MAASASYIKLFRMVVSRREALGRPGWPPQKAKLFGATRREGLLSALPELGASFS